jgi:hypothetical protein
VNSLLAMFIAVVGVCAFYWSAAGAIGMLRQRAVGTPWRHARIVLGFGVFAFAGVPALVSLLTRWRERSGQASRLMVLALPLGCAYGISYGISGAIHGKIMSRTGPLTGRAAREYGILLAVLAALGLALTAPLLLRWPG